MKNKITYHLLFWLSLIISFIQTKTEAYASHAQSADLTYQCIGGNQYQLSLSFYRDCAGANAPNSVNINFSSISCNQNFNATLQPIPGTGLDVTPICQNVQTQCNNGNYPGVQEYIYRGIVTLPAQCNDWVFSFTLCCRNAAINNIQNPGGENIYVEARLNNLNFNCNSSPTFSNAPIPFVCVGQNYCFNHGATDIDGDSLVYSLVAPATGPNTTVIYTAGYSALQPVLSNPPITFNSQTGDICMTPTQLEVDVLSVLVQEYRSGVFVGSVVRDIQLRTIVCNNNNPYLLGINGNGQYSLTACAGSNINFTIPTYDVDVPQNVFINWNNGIVNASFTSNGANRPTGTFNWTPGQNDISNVPHCFTITVTDDNCPYNGSQTYSFCITVSGGSATISSTNINCNGAANGTATVVAAGGQQYAYLWSNGAVTPSISNLTPGLYGVTVTVDNNCSIQLSTTITEPAPLVVSNLQVNNVSCNGANDGTASVIISGGTAPYSYNWNSIPPQYTPLATGLAPGNYMLIATDANNCNISQSIVVSQPQPLTSNLLNIVNVSCYGGNNGSVSALVNGGTAPYTYSWNTNPVQNTQTAVNLTAGVYTLTVTDNNACVTTSNATITQAPTLTATILNHTDVSCFGGNNGMASVSAAGGTPPYLYSWNTIPVQNTFAATNLTSGNYTVAVTDNNGCTVMATVFIGEPNQLTASINAVANVSCNAGNNGTATASGTGGSPPYSYLWNTIPVQNTQVATTLLAGNYTVTITDSKGCSSQASVSITESPVIVSYVSGGITICPGQSVYIIASATGGAGNFTFLWNNNLGGGASHQVNPNATTTYTVIPYDANGCAGPSASVTVTVNSIANVTLTVLGATTICEGDSTVVSAQVTNGIGQYQFNWNHGLGNGQGPHNVGPTSTTYYVVTITDDCGNSRKDSVLIKVNPLPQIVLVPQTVTGCGDVTLAFKNNAPFVAGSKYYWDFGDNTTSNVVSPNKEYKHSGMYKVLLTVVSPQGCINSASVYCDLTVNPQSVAAFLTDNNEPSILYPTVSFYNKSKDASNYLWDFGDGETSTEINPVHTYAAKGLYRASLQTNNTFGCSDTVSDIIAVVPEFTYFIPNAFTPNGDGENDIFNGKGLEIKQFSMSIFNRWGELIFATENLDEGWDGSSKKDGSIVEDAVYVYQIEIKDFKNRLHSFNGAVALLK